MYIDIEDKILDITNLATNTNTTQLSYQCFS